MTIISIISIMLLLLYDTLIISERHRSGHWLHIGTHVLIGCLSDTETVPIIIFNIKYVRVVNHQLLY